LNGAPDGTIDEVIIWPNFNMAQIKDTINKVWKEGRYYRGNDGVFTSRLIDLAGGDEVTGAPVTILKIAWTYYQPEPEGPPFTPAPWEFPSLDPEKGARCEIGLCYPDKSTITLQDGYLKDFNGAEVKETSTDLPDGKAGKSLVVTFPIRYRVFFKPSVQDQLSSVLVDTLIFDDITIIYYTVPKFLAWAYRR
jgi:hypothetical protein